MPRTIVTALLCILFAAASVFLIAGPASAHDQLLATNPAAGSSVAELPTGVTMTFDAVVLESDTGDLVTVTDASGASVADGRPKIEDNVVTQRLKGSATGVVTVTWRVVSEDGHPVSGQFTFTVTGSSSPAPSASGSASTSIIPPGVTASPLTSEPLPGRCAGDAPDGSCGGSAIPWIILGAVTIAAMAGVGYLVVSRFRRDRALSPSAPADGSGTPPEPETEDPSDR